MLAVALAVVLACIGVLWVAVAREPGPGPVDAAVSYELAWDRMDFPTLYDLSGEELRDGMSRADFVAAEHATYGDLQPGRGAVVGVDVESVVTVGDSAHVITVVESHDGRVRNDVQLERRQDRWVVVGYGLRPERGSSPASA